MHPMHAPSESDLVSEFYQAYFGYLDDQPIPSANVKVNVNVNANQAQLQGAESGPNRAHSLVERSASAPPYVSNQQQPYRQNHTANDAAGPMPQAQAQGQGQEAGPASGPGHGQGQ